MIRIKTNEQMIKKVTNSGRLFLPTPIMSKLEINPNEYVEFEMNEDGLIKISPVIVDVKVTRKSDQPVISTPNPTPVKKKKRQG